MFTNLHKNFPSIRRNREDGFTLVEILVALAVFAVIAAISTSIIVTWNNGANKFSTTAATQNDVTTAVSTITRDISAASKITEANDNMIHVEAQENGLKTEIAIFPTGLTGVVGPTGIDNSKIPAGKNLVEYRVDANGTASARVLIPNYDPSKSDQPLFKYYDSDNAVIPTPVATDALGKIIRVQIFVSTKLNERGTPVEVASSAIPRTATSLTTKQYPGTPPGVGNNINPPTLDGKITAGDTTAQLWWTSPSNATGYTVYRKADNESNFSVVTVVGNPATTKYNDGGLTFGRTYSYYVTASSPWGPSDPSNIVALTVVPPAPVISNINTTKALNATKSGSGAETGTTNPLASAPYTVARGLVNQIVWAPSLGATKYTVLRDGIVVTSVTSTGAAYYSWQDTDTVNGPNYGATHNYTVFASNTGYNSGGQSLPSNVATLISPPTASTIVGVADSSSTNSTYSANNLTVTNRAPNTTGYNVKRETTQSANHSSQCTSAVAVSALSFTSANVSDSVALAGIRWGSASCYVVTPYNDAGDGQLTRVLDIDQMPAPFVVTASQTAQRKFISQYAGSEAAGGTWASGSGTNGNNTVRWATTVNGGTSPYGATKYVIGAERNTGWATNLVDPGTINTTVSTGTNVSYTFGDVTPGSWYRYSVTAAAANGKTRGVWQGTGFATTLDIPYQFRENIRRNGSTYQVLMYIDSGVYWGLATGYEGGYQFSGMSGPWWNGMTPGGGPTGSDTMNSPCAGYCYTIGTNGQVRSRGDNVWGMSGLTSLEIRWTGFLSWWISPGTPQNGWQDVSWDSDYKFRSA